MPAGEGPRRPKGIMPCRVVCSAGLRWCGGWRRTNLRGSHDQAQNQAESCDPLDRPKDCQACVSQAIGTCINRAGRETRHQAGPCYCDAANGCGRHDRFSRYRNTMAATFGARLSCCQSAPKIDPVSASNFDPLVRRGLIVALGSSELVGVAETRRARVA